MKAENLNCEPNFWIDLFDKPFPTSSTKAHLWKGKKKGRELKDTQRKRDKLEDGTYLRIVQLQRRAQSGREEC